MLMKLRFLKLSLMMVAIAACGVACTNDDVDDEKPIDVVDYEFVDLGLSVNWATCNVGSKTPEGSGDLYAWGETDTDSIFEWSSYSKCKGTDSTLTKYCNNGDLGYNGYRDNKTVLDLDDDVAHVKWGGKWRMPTVEEFNELLVNCTWEWTNQKGVDGYMVVSNKAGYNDRSIFLPMAGIGIREEIYNSGRYWTSSLDTLAIRALNLDMYSDDVRLDNSSRDLGYTIRPVCTK